MAHDDDLVRRALVISAASAVWTFSSSVAAVLIGLENDSLALGAAVQIRGQSVVRDRRP
jgi:hypothetical protein